jgi:flagellar hook-basal body complex protein FliE
VSNTIQGLPQIDWGNVQLEIRKSPGQRSEFFQKLEGAMDKVEDLQSNAEQQVSDVLQGNGKDLHAALIAVEKADLSFQLMMQVRNKIVQAYQEISRMPF